MIAFTKNKHFTSVKPGALLVIFIVISLSVKSQAFITNWITTDNTITIPTNYIIGYNYNVSWTNLTNAGVGNGSIANLTGSFTITGLSNGDIYQVAITGAFPQIYFGGLYFAERPKIISIVQWGNIAWQSMQNAFLGCTNLTYSATDAPNLTVVTLMDHMFYDCTSFNGNLNNWNTANVTDMSFMFFNATAFNQPIGNWNTTNVTNMNYMFYNAVAFNQPIGSWNTLNVTFMSGMFYNAISFNQPIGNWNTGSVTNMSGMFSGASSFNQPVGNWNTINVTILAGMFQNATAFNQPIGSWNTISVTDMSGMFFNAASFNQPIGSWNTGNVTKMTTMFRSATVFNQPIGSWNTVNVTDMSFMFYYATSFNQPIGSWNTGKVTNMSNMFNSATSFNQPIGSWNTINVTNMSIILSGATSFNQSLGSWNITNVTDMLFMLNSSGLSLTNYDNTLIGWAAQTVKPNIQFWALGLKYCNGASARLVLTSAPNNWQIVGDVFNCTLPVKLLSFTGQLNTDNSATINWKTTNEINHSHFEIERSSNGNNFTKAGFVNGTSNPHATQNYEFRDIQKITDVAFYRLRQVDRDGRFEFSHTIQVKNTGNKNISIYPNPVINELYINCRNQTINYRIINSSGQIVLSGATIPGKAIQLHELQKGLYFIHSVSGVLKFVKQ